LIEGRGLEKKDLELIERFLQENEELKGLM